MAIITISRGSFSKGREVAEKVAKKLHYTIVSREVLIKASKEFNIPEIKLAQAIHDAPSFLERFSFGRERYLAHIESTILEYFQKDNVVYHGLAGHFFVKNIPHVLKVRIIADLEDRIATEMARQNISREQALKQLQDDDYERRQWSLKLYGLDTSDPGLYDLTLHIRKLSVDDAADIICHTVKLPRFQTTPESQQSLDYLALAAKVEARKVNEYPLNMPDIVKQFFAKITEGLTGDQKMAHAFLVAVCALMVELVRTEGTFSQTEMEAILTILQEKYGLSQEDADTLVAETQKKLDEGVDLWQFAKLIDENYSIDERIEIVENLWRIVYVSGNMDKYEHHLMHKFGKLLRLTNEELIAAKLIVLHTSE